MRACTYKEEGGNTMSCAGAMWRAVAAALRPSSSSSSTTSSALLTTVGGERGASVSGFASSSRVAMNAHATSAAAEAAAAAAVTTGVGNTRKLADTFSKELVDSIYRSSFKNQTGVSLKYMMDFGSQPIQRQLMMSSQFLLKARKTSHQKGLSLCFSLSFPRRRWHRRACGACAPRSAMHRLGTRVATRVVKLPPPAHHTLTRDATKETPSRRRRRRGLFASRVFLFSPQPFRRRR